MTVLAPALAALTVASFAEVSMPETPVEVEGLRVPLPTVVARESAEGPAFGPPAELAPPPYREPLPDVLPFGVGEWLRFSIDYGVINAGGATMEVSEIRKIAGRECLDVHTEARSNAFFSKFYKVWDRAQSFLDAETLLPIRFEKHIREGGYRHDKLIKFDRNHNFALYENGDEVLMHPFSQDELSAFYYLRTLPLEVGRDVSIDTHSARKNYPAKVIVHRKETIEVEAGTFDCFVVEPVLKEGGIFTAKGTLTIWITDDERRIPVKMNTKVLIGSVSATLQEFRLGENWVRVASGG